MSRRNRCAAKRQDANHAFGDKIGAAAGSLSALYLLPTVAQAAIVHNPGPGPSLDLNAFFSTSVTWKVDGINPAFALRRSATSFTQPVGGGGCPTTTTCVAVANTIRTGTLFFSNALNGRGFVTSGGRLAALNTGLLIGSALAAPYAFGGPIATLARRSQSLYYGKDNAFPYFPDGTNFIGFKFLNPSDSNNVDFGWARLSFDGSTGSAALLDWAYACGGASIAAGDQTSSTTSCSPGGGGGTGTAPEPSSLALLALGAAGLAAFRRRKREESAAAAA